MADDLTNKLMGALADPEMMKKISETMGALSHQEGSSDSVSAPSGISAENIQKIINAVNSAPDRRINLLNAIKPYMRSSRAASVDRAIQMLRITKLGEILKK